MYIRKKGKNWYFQVQDANGKRHEYAGGSTEEECQESYREYMARHNTSALFDDPMKMPLKIFLQNWAEKELSEYSPNTIDTYTRAIQNHILPELGEYTLKKLTPVIIYDFLKKMRDAGATYSTVNVSFSILKAAFKWGVFIVKYVPQKKNPVLGVTMPKFNDEPVYPVSFSEENIRTIFTYFPAVHKFYIPCMIAYCTGLRLGECLSLRWSNVNMDTHSLKIDSTLFDKNGDYIIQDHPKRRASYRTVAFGKKLYDAFTFQKSKQDYLKKTYPGYQDTDIVCTETNGKPMTSESLRYFNMFCKKQFGKGYSFHSFRHTQATILTENGVEIEYTSKRLGHSSVRTTQDVYVKITEKRNKDVMDKLDELL